MGGGFKKRFHFSEKKSLGAYIELEYWDESGTTRVRLSPQLLGKALVFQKFANSEDKSRQTIFCLTADADAELLRSLRPEAWVNAARVEDLTIHSYL